MISGATRWISGSPPGKTEEWAHSVQDAAGMVRGHVKWDENRLPRLQHFPGSLPCAPYKTAIDCSARACCACRQISAAGVAGIKTKEKKNSMHIPKTILPDDACGRTRLRWLTETARAMVERRIPRDQCRSRRAQPPTIKLMRGARRAVAGAVIDRHPT